MKDDVSKYLSFAGLVMLVLGTVLYAIRYTGVVLTWVVFSAGAASIVVTLVLNFRSVVAFSKKRSARYGVNSFLVTVFFAAILVVVQAVSVRNTHRYDVTRNKRFTLAEQTVDLLKRLDSDVQITGFFRKNTQQRLEAQELKKLYEHESGHVRFELVDPDQQPNVAETKRAGYGDVVVEHETNRRVVKNLTEEKLTNAILLVTRKEQKVIYFTRGHDEKGLSVRERDGYSMVKRALEEDGYAVYDLSVVDFDAVPSDCDVLVIGGPRKDFLGSEADKLAAYLNDGGDAVFLLDPRRSVPNLEAILKTYRVAMDDVSLFDELVISDAGEQVFDATVTKVRRYENHAITRDFRVITMYPMARPVRILPEKEKRNVEARYLAYTERSAWGETDFNSFRVGQASRDTSDVQGPLPVALVAEKTITAADSTAKGSPGPDKISKIVVFGDSDFITNSFYGVLGNGDFFMNAMGYLAEEEDLLKIRARRGTGDQIFMTASQGRLVLVLCLVLLPLSVVATGTYVFAKKRKA